MKGDISLILYNDEVGYTFSLNRKYSILTGNSATGKSTLRNMIARYYRENDFRSITTIECKGFDRVVTIEIIGENFSEFLHKNSNCLIVLDEDDIDNLKLGNYSKELNKSDNYFLFITRDPLGYLAYSYLSIYKVGVLKGSSINSAVVNTLENIYSSKDLVNYKPDLLISEDKKSGYQFFEKTLNKEVCRVKSSNGKGNIISEIKKVVRRDSSKCVYVIADGAGFGSNVTSLVEYLTSDKFMKSGVETEVYLPESFEYLLLNTGLFDIDGLKDKLENTQNYCEASDCITWERYYTRLMEDNFGYRKGELDDKYLSKDVVQGVYNQIRDLDKSYLVVRDYK